MKECKCCNSCVDENETICPVCGRALYDNTKSLPKDDENKLQHMNTEELSDDDLKISFTDVVSYFNNHRKGVFIGFISILAIIIVFIASSFISTVCKYNKAEEALTNSLYDEAIELYESISNYKDSDEKLHEAKYRKADALVKNKEYDNAIALYRELGAYKNSADKIKDATYQKGENLIEQKSFTDAISIFTNLGDYKNSRDLLKEANYQYGYQLVDKRQFLDAIKIFESLGEYKDSNSMITECNYRQGSVYLNNKEYEKAITLYDNLGDYKESKTQKTEALYQKSLFDIEQGNSENAYSVLVSLGDYKDTKKILNNFQYAIVSKEEANFITSNEPKKWIYHYDVNGEFSYMNVDGDESKTSKSYNGNPKIRTNTPGRHYTGSYNSPTSVSYYDKNGYLTDETVFNDDGSIFMWSIYEYSNGWLVKSESAFGNGPSTMLGEYIVNGHSITLYSYDSNGRITEEKTYGVNDNDRTTKLDKQIKYNYGYIYVNPQ